MSNPVTSYPGGIDFNLDLLKLEISRHRRETGRNFNLPDMNRSFEHIHIDNGLFPIIINITPITNLPAIFGSSENEIDPLAFSDN